MDKKTLLLKQNGDNHDYVFAILDEDLDNRQSAVEDLGSLEDLHSLMEIIEDNKITEIKTNSMEAVEIK